METSRPCHEELEAAPHPGVASFDPTKMAEDQNMLFHSLEDYCWEDDPEFQSGLDSILRATTSPNEVRALTQRAKCFFYSRKIGKPIDFNAYKEWLHKQEQGLGQIPSDDTPGPAVVPTPTAEAPSLLLHPASSFADTSAADGSSGSSASEEKPKGLLRQESIPSPPVPHAVLAAAATAALPNAGIKIEENEKGVKMEEEDQNAQYPTSFAHIVELITTGQPIPGIREIPDTLNAEAPSASVKAQRLKPWETQQQPMQDLAQDGMLQEQAATAVAQE